MEQKHIAAITLGGFLCLAVVVVHTAASVSGLDGSISKLIETYGRSKSVQTLTEVVDTQSGRTITVTTVRNDSESPTDFAKRHDDAVQAALLL